MAARALGSGLCGGQVTSGAGERGRQGAPLGAWPPAHSHTRDGGSQVDTCGWLLQAGGLWPLQAAGRAQGKVP